MAPLILGTSVEDGFRARPAIGIEIGSLYLKCVEIDGRGATVWHLTEQHRGDIAPLLERCQARANNRAIPVAVATRGTAPPHLLAFDAALCLATGARASCPDARNILEVGASTLTLVRVDEQGHILSVHRNALCAAGSGSFLDEQASRLNIDRDNAGAPMADPPGIATRCAVFAKSDLVHRQQEGWSPEAVWSGLCRGLADGVLRTLTYGRPLAGLVALCGGVARDPSFVWWFERCVNARDGNGHHPNVQVVPAPELTVARGAALLAARTAGESSSSAGPARARTIARPQRPPLSLVRSHYPETTSVACYVDDRANEISLHGTASNGSPIDVVLGLDIGSTSTKCALVTRDGRLLLDIYRRTEGDPIGAVRKLLVAITEVEQRCHLPVRVRAAATTGSGRKITGKVFGADLVVNEISAHAAGAVHLDPRVETIFEIGGQDAKYMAIRHGQVADANMNYVCAAGTGSFVEECATKLGYAVQEVGDTVLGVAPPFTSSRCTVFMEQDVLNLLQQGASRREALGAVLYSVVENYLERVVGRRPVNRHRVFFQGATARNRGLVAAIENLLGVEVVVSPCCHVMGAYGAALLASPVLAQGHTRFRGLDLGSRNIELVAETCELCVNRCRLTRAAIEGEDERPAWGMVCGRDEHDRKMRVPAEYALMRKRMRVATLSERPAPRENRLQSDCGAPRPDCDRPRIGLPLALSSFSFVPFWDTFFREIGMRVVPSAPTSQPCLEKGKEHAPPEVCLPLKAAYGHVAQLADEVGVDAVFVPHMIADHATAGIVGSKFCPYVTAAPSLARSAAKNGTGPKKPVVSPVVDLTLSNRWNAERLVAALRPLARIDRDVAERAFAAALDARERQRDTLLKMGRDAMARMTDSGKPAIVLIGRPYNTLDTGISLDVPYHIADCGFDIIPMDCLPFEPQHLTGPLRQMFWHYGQEILSRVTQVARTDGLYGVYLTSFGCGPDSFLLNYAEAIMGDKPFLILELDEHGSNGGYQTRIEAFLDVIKSDFARRPVRQAERAGQVGPVGSWPPPDAQPEVDWKKRTIWIPAMHPVGNPLFAAMFRARGFDARLLPPEDDEAHAIGKRTMRGAECLPCPLVIGSLVKQLREQERDGRDRGSAAALFMPASTGPCRFGQYGPLARLILDRLGYHDVPILAPSQETSNFEMGTDFALALFETIVASDILLKMRCRVRPYETTAGDTDQVLDAWVRRLEGACASGRVDWRKQIAAARREFARIPRKDDSKPLVGIVGEIYVRCNRYANCDLLGTIERLGGEAWLAPIGEWVEYCAWADWQRARAAGAGLRRSLGLFMTLKYMIATAHRMYRSALPLLKHRLEPGIEEVVEAGGAFVPPEFEGEGLLTLGRTVLFAGQGADLVVNCAPFNCMHGNITTALFEGARDALGVPIVNLFYDGGEDDKNPLATFLSQWRVGQRGSAVPAFGPPRRCRPS